MARSAQPSEPGSGATHQYAANRNERLWSVWVRIGTERTSARNSFGLELGHDLGVIRCGQPCKPRAGWATLSLNYEIQRLDALAWPKALRCKQRGPSATVVYQTGTKL